MQHTRIQNDIIRKILDVEDDNFLEFIQELLNVKAKKKYQPSDAELLILNDSSRDFKHDNVVSNEDVFLKIDRWLEK